MHTLIFIPGLGGNNYFFSKIVNSWRMKGFNSLVFDMNWKDGVVFEKKFKMLVDKVDEQSSLGKVSIIGTSAGGSATINVFHKRSNLIHKVVNVCGRLKIGTDQTPSLDTAAKSSSSFKQSVIKCEDALSALSVKEKRRIQVILPMFDEVVPVSTMTVEGALNETILSIEHMLSISLALTVYSEKIVKFIET